MLCFSIPFICSFFSSQEIQRDALRPVRPQRSRRYAAAVPRRIRHTLLDGRRVSSPESRSGQGGKVSRNPRFCFTLHCQGTDT